MTKRKSITRRTPERLQRAAYEYEHLAAKMRAEGFVVEASHISEIASRLGKIGRDMADKFQN